MALDANKFIVTNGAPSGGDQVMQSSAVGPSDVTANTAKTTNASHTGDATGDTALTLATVNSNIGSFTNADVTVNAKGLITAVANGSGGGGSGDVSKVGIPVNNQVGVWTGDGTIEGTSGLTYDGTNLSIGGSDAVTISAIDTQAEVNAIRTDLIAIGITASTTQTQGQGALTSEHNFISTVANTDDTITLPTAVSGLHVVVFNEGANQLQIFPATSDDLGQGVNTATTILPNEFGIFRAKDATNWNTVISRSTVKVSTYTTTGTIDRADMFGAIIRVTGAAVLTLPARESGMHCTFKTIGAIAVSVKPSAADLLTVDGVELDDGDKATNLSTAGDMCVLTDAGGPGFDAATNGWTDTGA